MGGGWINKPSNPIMHSQCSSSAAMACVPVPKGPNGFSAWIIIALLIFAALLGRGTAISKRRLPNKKPVVGGNWPPEACKIAGKMRSRTGFG